MDTYPLASGEMKERSTPGGCMRLPKVNFHRIVELVGSEQPTDLPRVSDDIDQGELTPSRDQNDSPVDVLLNSSTESLPSSQSQEEVISSDSTSQEKSVGKPSFLRVTKTDENISTDTRNLVYLPGEDDERKGIKEGVDQMFQREDTNSDGNEDELPKRDYNETREKIHSAIDIRKNRTVYKTSQLNCLNRIYEWNPYPDTELIEQVSQQLNIDESKIKVWFQNKRARMRRKNLNNCGTSVPKPAIKSYDQQRPAWELDSILNPQTQNSLFSQSQQRSTVESMLRNNTKDHQTTCAYRSSSPRISLTRDQLLQEPWGQPPFLNPLLHNVPLFSFKDLPNTLCRTNFPYTSSLNRSANAYLSTRNGLSLHPYMI